MKKNLPLISIIIPTYNEEKNIAKCLESIFRQDYPKGKLEVIIVDDLSTDKTIEVAKDFPVKLLFSGKKHAEISKMKGFREAKGEFAMYLDADIELKGTDWLSKMVKPLLENSEIIGSFTRYYSLKNDPPIERYLCFDELQRDSIYQFFSPSIKRTIILEKSGYFICQYTKEKIPPAGLCLYRRNEVFKLIKNYELFLELDFLVLLVENDFKLFAYVPQAGMYHHHASTVAQLVKKRIYNLNNVYLGRKIRLYKWFDLSSLVGFIKVCTWILFANLIIPSLLLGLYKTVKYRDWVGLYEPLLNLLITDIIIYGFLRSSQGRKLITAQ
jgi:glycosyltransferase involved in cell wall biosynthesis